MEVTKQQITPNKKRSIVKDIYTIKAKLWLYKITLIAVVAIFIVVITAQQISIKEMSDKLNELTTQFICHDHEMPTDDSMGGQDDITVPSSTQDTIPSVAPTTPTEPEEIVEPSIPQEDAEESANTTTTATLPAMYEYIPLDTNLKEFIYLSAIKANIPPEIMFALAYRESSFNPNNISGTNDHGLFQINACNFEWMAKVFNCSYEEVVNSIYDPYFNTQCAIYILTNYRDNYTNENWHHVLMRYNLGPSGASKKFKEGMYTTAYTRKIMEYAESNFGFTNIGLN